MADSNVLPPSYELDTGLTLPPAYNTSADGGSTRSVISTNHPINSTVPRTLSVGGKQTKPLVLPSELLAHLVLLGAFYRLREEVLTTKSSSSFPLKPEDRWLVFISRAVHRFQCWVTRAMVDGPDEGDDYVRGQLKDDDCPPLDVTMVWLVYMLVRCSYLPGTQTDNAADFRIQERFLKTL